MLSVIRDRAVVAVPCVLALVAGCASAGGPVVSVHSVLITGNGETFIAGGPLSDADEFDLLGTQLNAYATGFAGAIVSNCPGCPDNLLGLASSYAQGIARSPLLLPDQLTWRLLASLSSDAASDAVQYNAGAPDFQTAPAQVSAAVSASLTLAFDLHRPVRTHLGSFSAACESVKVLTSGTASSNAVLTLLNEDGTAIARVDTQASATQAGATVRDDESAAGAAFILDAGRYTLMATHSSLTGGVASGASHVGLTSLAETAASIDFTPCPLIDKQPESIEAHHGAQIEFLAQIDVWIPGGGGRWTWRRNGVPLAGNEPGITILFPTLPTSILFIASANVSHLGEYDAIWSGACGPVPSDPAQLTFKPCTADLNGDYIADIFDVTAFLNAYSAHNPIADWIPDGIFDFFDVQAYLLDFARGCH